MQVKENQYQKMKGFGNYKHIFQISAFCEVFSAIPYNIRFE